MNVFSPGPAVAAIVAVLAVQYLLSNRSGSEQTVKPALTDISSVGWNFVALQYCFGISNRTFLIFVTKEMICGAKVRGALPAPGVVTERWQDPLFYPRPKMVTRYLGIDTGSAAFKKMDSANFQIHKADVDAVIFNAEKKWGMGAVPYSGRIIIGLRDGSKIELILLGVQDGMAIKNRLLADGFGG
jgi:hypothetical protein